MNRWIGYGLVAVVGFLCWVVVGFSQENMTHVDNTVFPKAQRSAAVFLHERHNEAAKIDDCGECHHVYKDGKKVEDETSEDRRCADCHGLKDKGRQPGLTKAFHLNCKGCHEQQGKGPIMCGQCHVK